MKIRILLFIVVLLTFSALAIPQAREKLPLCPKELKGKIVGKAFKIKVPNNSKLRKGKDSDYSAFAIGVGKKDSREWMSGIEGSNSTSGKPLREWINASESYSKKLVVLNGFNGGDWRGTLKNGNKWRYLGFLGLGSLSYYDVSLDNSAVFDSVIDDVCGRDS